LNGQLEGTVEHSLTVKNLNEIADKIILDGGRVGKNKLGTPKDEMLSS
jgi:hypothetical protein